MSFAYDSAARRSGLTSGGTASSYAYDPAGRLKTLTHELAGPSADQVIGLGYNPAGQIVQRTGSNDSYAWTGSEAVNRPYSVNGLNPYTAAGPASFSYDPNGSLTSDCAATFDYDANGNLISATNPLYSATYVSDAENRGSALQEPPRPIHRVAPRPQRSPS